jgi:hypothetical protein
MNDSKEYIRFAFNEIEKRIGHLKCPLCKNAKKDEFFIEERFYHIPSMTEGDFVNADHEASVSLKMPLKLIRAVPVSCKKCGHVMFFNIDMVKG